MNEQEKYSVIKKLVETDGNKKRAAVKLNCTVRHINRLINAYKKNGKKAFSHGNKGNVPACALSDDTKQAILLLYQNKYYDANISHFTELLACNESIHVSVSTVRTVLLENNILSPKAHKKTKRKCAERLQAEKVSAKSTNKIKAIEQAIVSIEDSHPCRPRCAYFGEMIQMDASCHRWFNNTKTYLHAAIDDSTGIVVGAYFDKQETLNGYYNVFKQILTDYGIPYMFYTDNRTVFEYKKKNSNQLEDDTFTQFGYACKQLGVALETTSIPQAKGRVERLFNTLQSRLTVELRLAGINTIEQANEFLSSYIKQFNAQFALSTKGITSVFEKQPSKEQINLYLSVITLRKINAGHAVCFNNKLYRPLDSFGSYADYHKGTEVLVIQALDGELYCSIHDKIYVLDEIPQHEIVSRNFNTRAECEAVEKEKKPIIPSMDHPWRKDNFMKYVHAMCGRETDWAS